MARRKTTTTATKLYAVSSEVRPTRAASKSVAPKRATAAKTAAAKTAAPRRRKSVAQAAKSGDELELLRAIRDRIAAQISRPDCPARELVALLKELRAVRVNIAKLEGIGGDKTKDQAADNNTTRTPNTPDDIDDSFDAAAL